MRTFVLVYFVLTVLGILGRLALLSWKEYPRETTWTRGQDCAAILASLGFAAWGAWLLWS